MKKITLYILICLIFVNSVLAEQQIQTSEILTIFEQLCLQSAAGWIQQGEIEAVHRYENFRNGEIVNTRETVVVDNELFTWNIQIATDDKLIKGKKRKELFTWNQNRTFVWDGYSYTLYFQSGNHAIVYENHPTIPIQVNGPLTAGHIPWGQGVFSLENLYDSHFSATREGGDSKIHIFLEPSENLKMELFIDPLQNNTVLLYTLLKANGIKIVHTYDDFFQWQGKRIPMNILIDRYDHGQLVSSNTWEILSVKNFEREEEFFKIDFQEQALIEHHNSILEEPVFYRYSSKKDIGLLLEMRYEIALNEEQYKQNCASVVVEQIFSEFDMSFLRSNLKSLVNEKTGKTTFFQIQEFFQKQGLFSLPIKTDIKELHQLKDCQVILYLPKKKHFVLLDQIDKDYAWIIDLHRQTFYYNVDLDEFAKEWGGIALVVSQKTLDQNIKGLPVPEPILKRIIGSADYSCSDLVQKYKVVLCPETIEGNCGGYYEMWYDRYACEVSDSSGCYCEGKGIVGSIYSECIEDPSNPEQCTTSGSYISRPMRACQPY